LTLLPAEAQRAPSDAEIKQEVRVSKTVIAVDEPHIQGGIRAEVISARPEWVELRVPCDLADVPPFQQLVTQLQEDMPCEIREAIAFAFREMLNNAIEHGCKQDLAKRVEISHVRFKRAIICWIKDPGEGFDPARLEHAAVSNPDGEPFRHVLLREAKGMRPGGFGLMVTNQLVDELVYNERHNELMFIKYLS
jgi:anti-sigma regulatory factor (Ser/Thr protein kinase)